QLVDDTVETGERVFMALLRFLIAFLHFLIALLHRFLEIAPPLPFLAHEVFPPFHACRVFFNTCFIAGEKAFRPFAVPSLSSYEVFQLDSHACFLLDNKLNCSIQFFRSHIASQGEKRKRQWHYSIGAHAQPLRSAVGSLGSAHPNSEVREFGYAP